MPQDTIQPLLEDFPMAALASVGLAALIVLGLLLWLLGRKLARPACVVSGLVLGGLAGWMTAEAFAWSAELLVPMVVGLGVAGALLAALLFRVWMGLSAAGLLALAVPAAVILWQGTPLPQQAGPDGEREAQQEVVETELTDEGEEDAGPRTVISEEVDQAVGAAAAAAQDWAEGQVEAVRAWWNELDSAVRQRIYLAAGFGAVVGLVLGLVMPYISASAESALVGSILILLPATRLAAMHAPGLDGFLPHTPRSLLLWLGLITLVGIMIQWILFRKRAD